MKTRRQIQNWILENCVDKKGNIYLSHLDFRGYKVYLNFMRADEIHQNGHEAKEVWQCLHTANDIWQEEHEAKNVYEGKHINVKPKQKVTFELTEEQLKQIKKVLDES